MYRDYWIDIGTPDKYMQVHRDIMDGRYAAPPFDGQPGLAWVSPDAQVEERRAPGRAAVHRRGLRREGRRAHRPLHGARRTMPSR